MGWLLAIALCLIFPILLFIHTIYLPPYCMLCYFIWMITSILIVAYSKPQKIVRKAIFPALITFIYAIIHCVSMYNHANTYTYDIEAGTVFAIVLGTFLCLPLILLVGYFLGIPVEEKRKEKIEDTLSECKKILNEQLTIKNNIIKVIDEYYLTAEKTLNLIRLIDNLHTDKSINIKSSFLATENKRFLNCRESLLLKIDISERKNFPKRYVDIEQYYKEMKSDRENLKNQLKNIKTLDLKELKELQKRN